jgi:bifunctional UDP-N-acetylglucosamine pyrophosphorylase/glucosamine-1-phosphate N-acetyltransferase
MDKAPLAVIVLAAGLGTRMKSNLPKVMHPLAGQPLIRHVIATVEALDPERIAVVVGAEMAAVSRAVQPHPTVVQEPRLGTGHAVQAARPLLEGFGGDVLIVYGDTPLLPAATLRRMIEARRGPTAPAVVVLGFRPETPGGYGRLLVDGDGRLEAIIEAKDASPEQLALPWCNSGVIAADGASLFALLDQTSNDNAKGEYYLTDIVAIARAQGLDCRMVAGEEADLIGINSRADLARAEAFLQDQLRARALADGVTLTDPASVFLAADTRLGRDVVIEPFVVFGPGVTIGEGVTIRSFSHIEQAAIEAGASIGPFARLRPGAAIGAGAHIGNFVEVKNSAIAAGAKVNHLTYIGDATVGAGANVGAGTITCNYDGFVKARTTIGAGAFIGSNTSLVAPVTVGDGAIVGAGSVIARDVAADALALTRGPHVEKPGWAAAFRKAQAALKAAVKQSAGS